MLEKLNRSVVDMPTSGIRRVAEMAHSIEGCVSLTLGEPGFDTPTPIREATKRALDLGRTHYPPNAGVKALRRAIAAFEARNLDVPCAEENVLVTAGSTEALACAIFATVSPGDEVIVPTPAFGLYEQQIMLAGGVTVPLYTAAHGFQIDADALRACVTPRTRAIIINSPNNPTGVVYTQASIDTVTALCIEMDLFLLYDAVYDRLAYIDPLPRPSAAALGSRLILCNAFSKPYAMTGWRVGYCIAQADILRQLAKVHAALVVGISTFSQIGCLDIFDVPIDDMLSEYRAQRTYACSRLAAMGLPVIEPQGAFYVFPSIARLGLDDETFVHRLMHEARVAVVPGYCFGAPGYIRISYCCPRSQLEEGLNRLETFLQTL